MYTSKKLERFRDERQGKIMKENLKRAAVLNLTARGGRCAMTGCVLIVLTGVFSMTPYEIITVTIAFLALAASVWAVYMNKKAAREARAM